MTGRFNRSTSKRIALSFGTALQVGDYVGHGAFITAGLFKHGGFIFFGVVVGVNEEKKREKNGDGVPVERLEGSHTLLEGLLWRRSRLKTHTHNSDGEMGVVSPGFTRPAVFLTG